jgi:hypothetical protein
MTRMPEPTAIKFGSGNKFPASNCTTQIAVKGNQVNRSSRTCLFTCRAISFVAQLFKYQLYIDFFIQFLWHVNGRRHYFLCFFHIKIPFIYQLCVSNQTMCTELLNILQTGLKDIFSRCSRFLYCLKLNGFRLRVKHVNHRLLSSQML